MSTKTPQGEYSGLGYFVREMLFKEFKQDRQPIELKWRKNLNAFKAITEKVWKKGEGEDWRSTTFIQMTKQKVLAAYAMVIDMLLQGGKFPFALIPSPEDEVEFEDLPDEERELVEDSIDDMTALIHQQLQDCNADRQLMKNVMSAPIYGETYAEKYVHVVTRKGYRKIMLAPEGTPDPQRFDRWEKFSESKNAPAFQYVSNWNIFRDLESEDIQSGRGYIKREMVSAFDLQKLKDEPFALPDKIDAAIQHATPPGGTGHGGEDDAMLPPILRDIQNRSKTIEKLRFWGRAPIKLVQDFENEILSKSGGDNFDSLSELEHDGNEVEIMLTMADTEIIEFALNDTGKRPLYRVVWEEKLDHAEATGVCDNIEDVQQVLNGMVRAFEDNIKLIANVLIAVKKRFLAPGALKDGIRPGAEIPIAEECDDARKAIQQVTIQDITGSLITGIPLFERYADEASQVPRFAHAMETKDRKPETLGEMQIIQTNTGKYLGAVIKNFDEGLIEPVTMDFFEYNMDDPTVTKGKGNFKTRALGFSSFQDRVIRRAQLMHGLNLAMSHEILAAEVKPREILSDLWKALDMDPTTIFKTAEEKQQEFEQQMELRAQEEARVRQLQTEIQAIETEAEIVTEDAKHEMELETKELEHDQDLEKIDREFENDLALKAIEGGQRNANQA